MSFLNGPIKTNQEPPIKLYIATKILEFDQICIKLLAQIKKISLSLNFWIIFDKHFVLELCIFVPNFILEFYEVSKYSLKTEIR
jgi:hypothetical protein